MGGTTLGPYRILEPIGSGGMGEVYRAHDERLQRDVALKLLPAARADDDEARARLLREARAAAALNHPFICTIYDVGEADGQVYVAMELVDGQPLDRVVVPGGLAVAQVLDYGVQAADAVAHAHDKGILHRDLKAANIMVTGDGRLKVLDFGLAKRFAHDTRPDVSTEISSLVSEPGRISGTLAYMSPEQLRGQPATAASDVWALGVVLYEMVMGERPFGGQTGFEVASAILERQPPALPQTVPALLRGIIMRSLAKEPSGRYRTAAELRAALEATLTATTHSRAVIGSVDAPAWTLSPRARVVARRSAIIAMLAVLIALTTWAMC
jgi:serine/threonine protein kinase